MTEHEDKKCEMSEFKHGGMRDHVPAVKGSGRNAEDFIKPDKTMDKTTFK
jgi:hypothetical protein